MSDNSLKTPLSVSIDAAARQRSADGDQLQGKGIPCKVTKIVSSNFVEIEFQIKGPFTLPKVVVPVSSEQYARVPYQVGDMGIAVPLDFYQGGISGLGGGTADFAQRGNLTNLRFQGIGNKDLDSVDLDAYCIYGKNGAVLYAKDGNGDKKSVVTINKDKIVVDLSNSDVKTVEIVGTTNITFDGNLRVKGNVTAGFGGAGSVTLLNHTHAQGIDGDGDSEQEVDPPTPGT